MSTAAAELVVDWAAIMMQLQKLGIGPRALGRELTISHSQLIEYREYVKTPNHANGERIIEYWCRATGAARDSVPMMPHVASAARA